MTKVGLKSKFSVSKSHVLASSICIQVIFERVLEDHRSLPTFILQVRKDEAQRFAQVTELLSSGYGTRTQVLTSKVYIMPHCPQVIRTSLHMANPRGRLFLLLNEGVGINGPFHL